jgi:hypothetical protein
MRGFFSRMKSFDDNDIIISIDADEIIYRESYDYIVNEVNLNNVVRLNLYQFFYKTTYLWEGKDFVSPIATKYSVFRNHFSWCMTPEEMVYKLHTYSHPRYRFCADKEILEKAIEEKEYPFDENVDFSIRELEIDDKVLPECIRTQSPYLAKVQV